MAAITERSSSEKNVNNSYIAYLLNFGDSAGIFKSMWQCLVCIKGILWKMLARLHVSLGFEIIVDHKSGFQVTFSGAVGVLFFCCQHSCAEGGAALQQPVCTLGKWVAGDRLLSAVSAHSPVLTPAGNWGFARMLEPSPWGCTSDSCSLSWCWKFFFPHQAKLLSSTEKKKGQFSFVDSRVLDFYLTVGGLK